MQPDPIAAYVDSVRRQHAVAALREFAECVRLVAAKYKPTWRQRLASMLYDLADWIYPLPGAATISGDASKATAALDNLAVQIGGNDAT